MDRNLYRDRRRGKHLKYGVRKEQQARHAIAIFPRPREGPWVFANFRKCTARYSMNSVPPIPITATSQAPSACKRPRRGSTRRKTQKLQRTRNVVGDVKSLRDNCMSYHETVTSSSQALHSDNQVYMGREVLQQPYRTDWL